jgi:hypothetical protein
MRIKSLLNIGLNCGAAAVMSVAAAVLAASPAAAFDWGPHAPTGWGNDQVVRHWIYTPRYHHVYRVHSGTDPYAYRSRRVGYYPYHGSGYWRPPQRAHHGKPPTYYPAWGKGHHHSHPTTGADGSRIPPWQY